MDIVDDFTLKQPKKRVYLNPDKNRHLARKANAAKRNLHAQSNGSYMNEPHRRERLEKLSNFIGSGGNPLVFGAEYNPITPDVDTLDVDLDVWRSPAEYRCVGMDQLLLSPVEFADRGYQCPVGYDLKQSFTANLTLFPNSAESVICESFPVVPPEPFCPPEYKPIL